MSIDQHNYELYILDYYEGNLDANATGELMHFLEHNPEAKDAFDSYETLMLEPDLNQHFEPKSSLKKTAVIAMGELNGQNFENYFTKSIEHNLSAGETALLEEFLQKNPQLQKIYDLYKKTILQPDKSIIFDSKEMLKKKTIIPLRPKPVSRFIRVSVSVAAVFAVIIVSGIIIRNISSSRICGKNMISKAGCGHCQRQQKKSIKQIPFEDNHEQNTEISNILNTENKTFANNNLPARSEKIEKTETRKSLYVKLMQNVDIASTADLSKRSEYAGIISERQQLQNRRNKEKENVETEGLANYMVKEIKNAARTTTKNQEDIKDNKKLGFWDIAGLGVYTYNKITDKNLILDKKTDASGRLMPFILEDENENTGEKK